MTSQTKTFSQWTPDGKRTDGLYTPTRRLTHHCHCIHLPEVVSLASGKVAVVEGEKCVLLPRRNRRMAETNRNVLGRRNWRVE